VCVYWNNNNNNNNNVLKYKEKIIFLHNVHWVLHMFSCLYLFTVIADVNLDNFLKISFSKKTFTTTWKKPLTEFFCTRCYRSRRTEIHFYELLKLLTVKLTLVLKSSLEFSHSVLVNNFQIWPFLFASSAIF